MLLSFWPIRWVQHARRAKGVVNYRLCLKCLIWFLSPPFSSSFNKVDFQAFGQMNYKKVSLGKKRADRQQAMLDFKNAVAQRSRSKLSWNLAYSRAQLCKQLTLQPSIRYELFEAWFMCPWNSLAAQDRSAPASFSVMLLSHVGEGSPFWATLTLLRRTLGMLPPSRSRSTDVGTILWRQQGACLCHRILESRVWNNWSSNKGCTTYSLKNTLDIIFFRTNLKQGIFSASNSARHKRKKTLLNKKQSRKK